MPKNLFGTPSGYVPSSSFGMPSEMMTGPWPQNQNAACQRGFTQGALATPQRTLPLTMPHQQSPQRQVGGPQTSPSAEQLMNYYQQPDPSAIMSMMNLMVQMMNMEPRVAPQHDVKRQHR